VTEPGHLTHEVLLQYFIQAAKPREEWRVGTEVELMARDARTGRPLPYDGDGPCIREILEYYSARRDCAPILEATYLIGLDGPWGSITLEPGGQVEWSSRPCATLDELQDELERHLALLTEIGEDLGVRWVEEAVDPDLGVDEMEWMPKARYKIMQPFLGSRGRLAHRMMTQTASIQCAYDYSDAEDWRRKFLASAWMAPVATALFANSSRVDGGPSGYQCYRQAIWRETDPARCGLPDVVFSPRFDLEAWLDWVLRVPTIFRHRARGLVPAGGVPFSQLLAQTGCDAVRPDDWETHVSTIFTEVRSYTYLEVRSADVQPRPLMIAVPTLWTGLLYDEQALDATLDLVSPFSDPQSWARAVETAAREGLDGRCDGLSLREMATAALERAAEGLGRLAGQFGGVPKARQALTLLAQRHGIE